MKKPKPFATEVELCKAFLAVLPKEWTPYAETGGWDIVLVRKADGFQIGVQAKLKANLDVISQALEEHGGGWWSTLEGPDCRAILVPAGEGRLGRIADYIGITVISMSPADGTHGRRRPEFRPFLPDGKKWARDDWHEWAPTRRLALPEYVPDVAAGSSAPLQLTAWKIAAIKIAVTIELRGYVTRDDFKHLEIDHRRWVTNDWLRTENGRWVAHRPPDFAAQHPRVYAEIKADAEKWMVKLPTLAELSTQTVLV